MASVNILKKKKKRKEIGLFLSQLNAFFLDSLVCYSQNNLTRLTFTNFLTRQLSYGLRGPTMLHFYSNSCSLRAASLDI